VYRYLLILIGAAVLFACGEKITREDFLFQVNTYVDQYKERPLEEDQYSLWAEHYHIADPYEELLLFDSLTLEGTLITPDGQSFATQFEKIIAANTGIIYNEAQKKLKAEVFEFNKLACPSIQKYKESLEFARKEVSVLTPPFHGGYRVSATFHSDEYLFKGEKSYANLTTIQSYIHDEPIIKELLELLEVVKTCKNRIAR